MSAYPGVAVRPHAKVCCLPDGAQPKSNLRNLVTLPHSCKAIYVIRNCSSPHGVRWCCMASLQKQYGQFKLIPLPQIVNRFDVLRL